MKRLLIAALIMGMALPVIAKSRSSEEIITPQTQLEKRQYQTRTYKANDQTAVLKSILNVLQDEGYIVYNVNSLLGFVYAVKDFDTTDPNIDISKEFGLSKSRLSYNGVKVATIETSANVTQYGENIRVRINFKRKLLNEYGNAQFIDDVSEGEFYSAFYEKLDNALNLHKELNAVKVVPAQKEKEEVKVAIPKDGTVVGPDLMKEINNHIEKVIKSETPDIPAIKIQEQKIEKTIENISEKVDKADKSEKIEKAEKVEKTEKIEKSEKAEDNAKVEQKEVKVDNVQKEAVKEVKSEDVKTEQVKSEQVKPEETKSEEVTKEEKPKKEKKIKQDNNVENAQQVQPEKQDKSEKKKKDKDKDKDKEDGKTEE